MKQYEAIRGALLTLNAALSNLSFAPPVTHVYNPLEYARESADLYLQGFIVGPPGRTLLLGMNPGPWGMAQTGVPFGQIDSVRHWLGIEAPVEQPQNPHPKRPILGFDCPRSEVSGQRLWGLFRERFPTAVEFAKRFVVFNYCPLVFMEESGRNRTPDKLAKAEREALFGSCDACLLEILEILQVERAFGVGRFATQRLEIVKPRSGTLKRVSSIIHPSPANPAANRGWAQQVAPVLGICSKELA